MQTPICPTCGCSLVRLGITREQATPLQHDGSEYLFCCQACADLFVDDPEEYLRETSDLIVCPTCLAEKPQRSAVELTVDGQVVQFCRCPYCTEVFQKDPDFYIKRLQGAVPNEGVLDHEACCVRPSALAPSTDPAGGGTAAGCCAIPHTGEPPTCPVNGRATKPIGRKTVESLVKPELRSALTFQPYSFCDAPDCDTVYVSALGDHVVTKDMLTTRVGIKEMEDPIPLCYCFGYDLEDVHDDIRRTGNTDIQRIITNRVRDGECRCEETNPSGGCCLGSVAKAIKHARATKEQGLL